MPRAVAVVDLNNTSSFVSPIAAGATIIRKGRGQFSILRPYGASGAVFGIDTSIWTMSISLAVLKSMQSCPGKVLRSGDINL
jgi:hypothetical protein